MQGEWIKRPKGGAAVVFVHGILSSGEACWRNENGAYWPELLNNEPELDRLGIYVFTYHTGIFSGNYRLGDAVDALKEHMRLDGLFESKRIIFVCHSMGGIVVRRFLVEQDADLIDRDIEIGLFLIASPSLGSSYANLLNMFAKLLGNSQADALRFAQNNAWLNDLDKSFMNLKEAGKLKIKGKELIEDKFIMLRKCWRKQVVEPFSGARYFGEPFKVPLSDHSSIAEPANNQAIQHRLLCRFIKEMVLTESNIAKVQETVVPTSIQTKHGRKDIMVLDAAKARRIQQLEEQLSVWQEKLHEFEMEIPKAEGPNAIFSIKQRIKNEIYPSLSRINKEYVSLLASAASNLPVTEEEAEPIVAELVQVIENNSNQLSKYHDVQQQLQEIRAAIADQNKSATAKLKVTLPLVPLVANYELDLDTEKFLTQIWGKIRGLLRKKVNP